MGKAGVIRARGSGLWGVTPETPAARVQGLWQRVLVQALLDALAPKTIEGKPPTPEVRAQSVAWLASPDCAEVCELAGYRAEWAMPRIAHMVARHLAGEKVMQPWGSGYRVGDVVVSMMTPGVRTRAQGVRRAA